MTDKYDKARSDGMGGTQTDTAELSIKRKRTETHASASEPLLADVAALAGVSTATISRVLNEPGRVSAKTHAKVNAAIQTLGWIPNAAARALASKRSYTIGAVVPTLGHEKFHQQIQALQERLGQEGLMLFVGCSNFDPEEGSRQVKNMLERGIDGLALLGEDYPDSLFKALIAKSIPYAIMFSHRPGSPHPSIGFDQFAAFEMITRHLLKLGHRSFGVISQCSTDNDRVHQRLQAIHHTLAESGIAVRPNHYFEMSAASTKSRIPFSRESLKLIMNSSPRPSAIICGNDYLAIGALLEARALGIRVPEELSITGFDDIEMAEFTDPPLTTVRAADQSIGKITAEYLIDRLAGKSPPPPAQLDVQLIERNSVGRVN